MNTENAFDIEKLRSVMEKNCNDSLLLKEISSPIEKNQTNRYTIESTGDYIPAYNREKFDD